MLRQYAHQSGRPGPSRDRTRVPCETIRRYKAVVLAFAFICIQLLAAPQAARADWPERTVKFVVTFPPGSANDAAARLFANALSQRWGKPVVIENKVGAEGTIGAAAFVAAQDDHTLLYTVAGTLSVAPLLVDKLPYDTDRDLVPIAATTAIVLTLALNGQLPPRTIDELIDTLKAHPGEYAWASGPSLPRHVFAAFLKRRDLQMNYVIYRDAAQPQADLGEGRIQFLLTSLLASSAPVQAGKARFLAVANPTRAAALPDLPTVRELGYPELEIDGLAGIFGNRAMSEPLRTRIASDVAAVCRDADVRRKLESSGHIVLNGSAEQVVTAIERQRRSVADITRHIDIRDPR
jgi:tripartite-type tricarboxylate transporter receptor subunit TctC